MPYEVLWFASEAFSFVVGGVLGGVNHPSRPQEGCLYQPPFLTLLWVPGGRGGVWTHLKLCLARMLHHLVRCRGWGDGLRGG